MRLLTGEVEDYHVSKDAGDFVLLNSSLGSILFMLFKALQISTCLHLKEYRPQVESYMLLV